MAGRAGRQARRPDVLIQCMPNMLEKERLDL